LRVRGLVGRPLARRRPDGKSAQPGVPDLNAIGFAEYGHRRGIFRVLDTLARENVKATMIVSGIMAERHAEIVRRISEAGHDIVAHSYAMDVIPIYLNEDEERANIRRTVDLIERAPASARPDGSARAARRARAPAGCWRRRGSSGTVIP
jgi:Predicted xylanase/chitin deacetylase